MAEEFQYQKVCYKQTNRNPQEEQRASSSRMNMCRKSRVNNEVLITATLKTNNFVHICSNFMKYKQSGQNLKIVTWHQTHFYSKQFLLYYICVLISLFISHIHCLRNSTGEVCHSAKSCYSITWVWHHTFLCTAFHLQSSFKLRVSNDQTEHPLVIFDINYLKNIFLILNFIPYRHIFYLPS